MRLFKHHLANLLVEVDRDTSLINVTPRSWVKKAAWVRNSTATYAGKTPLELAFGRRPRDVVSIENSTPSQLTAEFSPSELTDRQLQKLAMKSYLEVRQRDDVRRDLAQNLLPSQGPFQAGDRVYDWQVDPNKIKHGIKQGKWI